MRQNPGRKPRRKHRWATSAIVAAALAAGACLPLRAQAPETAPQGGGMGRGQFAGMQRVMGEITAVTPDKLTVKGEDGTTYQVVTTPNTRLMKQGGATFKVADLKPGDGVIAAGVLDAPNRTLHAAVMSMIDAGQMKKLEAARKQAQADLGKKMIIGRVTAIDLDNLKMTVERPDHVSQTIGFDEGTSFKRGAPGRFGAGEADAMGFGAFMRQDRTGAAAPANSPETGESITLADIKVGDNVNGPGTIKNGVFVPMQLTVRTPRAGGRRRGEGQQNPSAPPPSAPAGSGTAN